MSLSSSVAAAAAGTTMGSGLFSLVVTSVPVDLAVTNTCFLLLDPDDDDAGVTTTVVDFPAELGVDFEACNTLTTRVVPPPCGVLVPLLLKMAAVALLFNSVVAAAVTEVLIGVMVTPELVLAGCSRF